jgi:hypothetical protein
MRFLLVYVGMSQEMSFLPFARGSFKHEIQNTKKWFVTEMLTIAIF